jgi:hypothetical protein
MAALFWAEIPNEIQQKEKREMYIFFIIIKFKFTLI